MTTTIDSGELSGAISKWQVSVTAEGYGTYIYTNSKENTEEVTYERNFNVSVFLFSGNNIHLMYGLEGDSFVFPRVLMFPEAKSRETSGLEGKQNMLCYISRLAIVII